MTGRSAAAKATEAKPRANPAPAHDPLAPAFGPSESVRQLHAFIGNQVVGPLVQGNLGGGGTQADTVRRVLGGNGGITRSSEARLTDPNDDIEREADHAADLATRHLSTDTGPSSDAATVAELGLIFGRDFGRVRIHSGVEADHAARSLTAQAFTVNRDIYIGTRDDASPSHMRRRLLAHELTHVVQNNEAPARDGGARIHVSGRTSAPGVIARAVTPKYEKIEENLTYGLIDWAITDIEALEVMMILSHLSDEDLQDTVQRMEADGLVQRFLENFPEEHKDGFPNTWKKIQGARSPSAVTQEIESLMSYGLLDWAITDAEAHKALETLKDLRQANVAKFKQVVRIIEDKYFHRFLENVSAEDRILNKDFLDELQTLRTTGLTRDEARKAFEEYAALSADDRRKQFEKDYPTGRVSNMLRALAPLEAAGKFKDQVRELLRWIEEAETRAASGMSDEEMAKLQGEFMAARRKERAEEKIRKEEAKKKKEEKKEDKAAPEKPPTPTGEQLKEAHEEIVAESSVEKKSEKEIEWLKKKDEEKKAWEARGEAVIDGLVAHSRWKYRDLNLTKANFKFDYEGIERRGKRVYAMGGTGPSGDRLCQFGQSFVEAAEADLDYVMLTVVHEVFGHPEFGAYGTEYQLTLYDTAAAKMDGYTKPTGEERGKEIDNFAYHGTEIYAELRGAPYYKEVSAEHRTKGITGGGDPADSVNYRLKLIKQNWHPKLAPALARGLYQRFRNDPRITAGALKLYENGVRKVFGDEADAILK